VSGPILEARFVVGVGHGPSAFTLEAELALDRGVLVFFGPTGAGKSLALQALAGLVRPSRGRITLAGETLFDADRRVHVAAHHRRIGYVPQHHSLFPFHDVWRNVAFGLPRRERKRTNPRLNALLEETGLAHLADAKPSSLSGGERQKVALARALIVEPRLLLLDEPFASVDVDGRQSLRRTVRGALETHDMPAVIVTHDPDEALALGDTLIRFERGRTTHSGTPADLLRRGHPVHVRGKRTGKAEEVGDGRSVVTLEEARIEGPTTLLEEAQDGTIDLELRTRPRRPHRPDEEA
jgi:molybdate transport system ATP-binding protein